MRIVDRFLHLLALAGVWLIAGMIYVQFFHEGGRMAPPPAMPARMAVVNAEGAPLRVTGEVSLLGSPVPTAAPIKLKLACRLSGNIVTQKPGVRLFGGGDWKPEREWPTEARIDCETVEPVQ